MNLYRAQIIRKKKRMARTGEDSGEEQDYFPSEPAYIVAADITEAMKKAHEAKHYHRLASISEVRDDEILIAGMVPGDPVQAGLFRITHAMKTRLGKAEWASDKHAAEMFQEFIDEFWPKLKEMSG